MKTQQETKGTSLNASIRSMAQRDESFNEFLRSFKAKNEQGWANIIDATQDEKEELLLAKSPEYRRNEMIMLEEFRRRKNYKKYYELNKKHYDDLNINEHAHKGLEYPGQITSNKEADYDSIGPERHFTLQSKEMFDPSGFTLIFMDSDSVTNVTKLNRVNHRRVLIFCGNGRGMISYGKGKGVDYEQAFDQAFKKMRNNMVCLDWDENWTVPTMLKGHHNDFYIKIWP